MKILVPLRLRIFYSQTTYQLRKLEDYITHHAIGRNFAQQEFLNEYDSSKDDPEYDEFFGGEVKYIENVFPSIFRESTLITIYSFLETRLKALCELLQELKSFKISVNDLQGGSYVERSSTYLNLVINLDLTSLNPLWEKIKDYQKVRNCIAHNNGYILNNAKLPPIIKKYTHLNLSDGRLTIINDSYLNDFISLVDKYITGVFGLITSQQLFEV